MNAHQTSNVINRSSRMEIGSSRPCRIGTIDVTNKIVGQVIIGLGVQDEQCQEKQRNDSHDVGQSESMFKLKKKFDRIWEKQDFGNKEKL